MTQLQDIQNQFKEIKELEAKAKESYLNFIKDKTIPLNDRWALFTTSPSTVQEHQSWSVSFSTLENITEQNFSWYDHFNIDRHQTVYLSDIVNNIEVDIKHYQKYPPTDDGISALFYQQPEALNQLKEEILEQNLGTFVFDW